MCKTSIFKIFFSCLYNFTLPKYRQDPDLDTDPDPVKNFRIQLRIRILPKRSGSGFGSGSATLAQLLSKSVHGQNIPGEYVPWTFQPLFPKSVRICPLRSCLLSACAFTDLFMAFMYKLPSMYVCYADARKISKTRSAGGLYTYVHLCLCWA